MDLGLLNVEVSEGMGFTGDSVVKNPPGNAEAAIFLAREDPLEREMATRSSILAWETQWTEDPDRLQSMRPQKCCTRLID